MLDTNLDSKVDVVLEALGQALEHQDIDAIVELFRDDCYWRDLLVFTWNITTQEGLPAIRTMLKSQLSDAAPVTIRRDTSEPAVIKEGAVVGWFTIETAIARGYGHVRVIDGKIWTLLTTMTELKGHEEPQGTRRPFGAVHGSQGQHRTWKENRELEAAELGYAKQPDVLIIGGGQGGLALAARLRQLGVPTIIIEKFPRPGDSWRNRYKSLCLHDPVWYDHMPYLPFPENWPVYTPKDKIADWLEIYAKVMELNCWTSTTCTSASYDEAAGEWTVTVNRGGETVVLKPKQLVLATGMSGKANIPTIKGQDIFRGVQQHSSQHDGPDAWKGKKAVIVGSNNSAHDICAALWENGVDVTMLQRSSTHIVRSESLMELATGTLYSEKALAEGITTRKADMTFAAMPYGLMARHQKPVYDDIRARDAAFYEKLEKAGFMLDYGEDESGLFMKYLRRGSGYYIDVGASELIANGSIKLISGAEIQELTENGVLLADGRELPADLIVYATGYGSMTGWAADLISPEVAEKVGPCWGLGSGTTKDPGPWQGELRNMWKPTRQKGLWFHGGNLHQSRFYSLFLALQLKARYEGLPITVFNAPA